MGQAYTSLSPSGGLYSLQITCSNQGLEGAGEGGHGGRAVKLKMGGCPGVEKGNGMSAVSKIDMVVQIYGGRVGCRGGY